MRITQTIGTKSLWEREKTLFLTPETAALGCCVHLRQIDDVRGFHTALFERHSNATFPFYCPLDGVEYGFSYTIITSKHTKIKIITLFE